MEALFVSKDLIGLTSRLFAGAALTALVTAPCHAQAQANSSQTGAATTSGETNQSVTAAAQSPDDIVVTAQRREERLANVPISITAISGDQLNTAGVSTTQDLTQVTPGLVWSHSTAYSQPTIRGIGSRDTSPGNEPNVATYLDGVYQPESTSTVLELANVERVEVLKGPQGTLFGRNATGGAVNIITQRPSFDVIGQASISAGSFGYLKSTGFVSGPIISNKLAASVSMVDDYDHGYIKNVYLNTRQGKHSGLAVRGKILFTPTDRLEFQLNGLYSDVDDDVGVSGQPLNGNTSARGGPNPNNIPISILIPLGVRTTATGKVAYNNTTIKEVDFHSKYDLPWVSLSALLSYANADTKSLSIGDISPLVLYNITRDLPADWYNEQIIANSVGEGRIKWMIGAEGFQGSSTEVHNIRIGGQHTRSFSSFGEVTYEPVDNLFLIGGIRYNYDKKEAFYRATPSSSLVQGKKSWNNVVPRAVIRYEFDHNTNIYASYTEGFKSGSFSASSPAGAEVPANPEKVKAYEAGIKTTFGPVTLNAAAFYYDYTDFQTSLATAVGGDIVEILQNAPKAEIKGVEISGQLRVSEHLRLTTGISLLDPKFTNAPAVTVVVPVLLNGLPDGGKSVEADIAGNDLINAPRSTVSLGANYSTKLARGQLTIDASAYLSSKYYLDIGNRVKQPSFTLVNATIGWTTPDGHWNFNVFGRNLSNADYYAANTISTIADSVTYAKPRWFGGGVGFKY